MPRGRFAEGARGGPAPSDGPIGGSTPGMDSPSGTLSDRNLRIGNCNWNGYWRNRINSAVDRL
eukprot:14385248-Alexandrium_andersonii.AAC.1